MTDMVRTNEAVDFVEAMSALYRAVEGIHKLRSDVDSGVETIIEAAIVSRKSGKPMYPFGDDVFFDGESPPNGHLWQFIVQVPKGEPPYLSFGLIDDGDHVADSKVVNGAMKQEDLRTILSLISLGLFPRLLTCIVCEIQSEVNVYGSALVKSVKPPLALWSQFSQSLASKCEQG